MDEAELCRHQNDEVAAQWTSEWNDRDLLASELQYYNVCGFRIPGKSI